MPENIEQFYRSVDERVSELESRHGERLNCRKGCSSCCVDGITVFEFEAENIRSKHAELLKNGSPHPEGACAFLDSEGACRIYEDRPYVCRTQGLPLRWLDELEGRTVEYRDICPLNEEGDEPLESIGPEDCLTLGEFEGRLAHLENIRSDGRSRRISLRDLFSNS
ncbi:MAG: YkgJ family cysteine cluster protein [Acidobacteriota bacterium]|nr:MAG: YkgJ family cysteine cluster protein [Acidobacteriota bacterium]